MRGLRHKWENWRRLGEKRRQIRERPSEVRFDRTPPIIKEPFEPDDDAIILTNAVEIEFFLHSLGCEIEFVHCTDRIIPGAYVCLKDAAFVEPVTVRDVGGVTFKVSVEAAGS